MLKKIIPTQNIEQIVVELSEYDKRTGYTKFSINLHGILDGEFKLSGETIEKIYQATREVRKEVL